MEKTSDSKESKKQTVILDLDFSLKSFEGEPIQTLREDILEEIKKNPHAYGGGKDLGKDQYREYKAFEQISSFIGSSSKSFNDRAWEWRIDLHNKKSLTLDKVNLKTLFDFVKELKDEKKITNDSFYVNYNTVFQKAEKEFE